jgi:hypothetical protein
MPNRQQFSPLILIYTEGKDDALLIKHIQKLYGKNHKIRQGNGSTPEIILRSCVKELGAFDKRYCVLDGDTIQDIAKFQELINQYQSKLDYELIVVITYPCIEAVNLALLFEDDTGFDKANCGELKKRLKLQMEGKDREDYYIQNLTKTTIKQNHKLLKDKDFGVILDLMMKAGET